MYKHVPETVVIAISVATAILVTTVYFRQKLAFEPPYLSAGLNTIFIVVGYSLVAYVAAKSYMKTHSHVLLLLGSGVLAAASGTFASSWVPSDVNFRVTMSNAGFFICAVLQGSSAALEFRGSGPQSSARFSRISLISSYSGVLIAISLLGAATLQGITPPFFVQGVGGTQLRQVLLSASIILFVSASLFFFRLYRESRSRVLYWYCMGLALMADGMAAILFGLYVGGVLSWTGRIAQYLSGVYFLCLVITSSSGGTATEN